MNRPDQQRPMNETPDTVPWPQEWPKPRRVRPVVGVVVFAVIATVTFVTGVALVTAGHLTGLLLIVSFPALCGVMLNAVASIGMRSRTANVYIYWDALYVPSPLVSWVGFWLMVGGGVPVLGILAAVCWNAALAYNVPALLAAVPVTVLALVFALIVVSGILGNVVRTCVSVSAEGIVYEATGYDAYIGWDDVHAVSADPGTGCRIVIRTSPGAHIEVEGRSWLMMPSKAVRLDTAQGVLVIRGMSLSIDPALLLRMLRYYHTTVSARDELATDAAIERVQKGALR